MLAKLPCGCTVDDATHSTIHETDGRHYPIGASPGTFCPKCDLYQPCVCSKRIQGLTRSARRGE